jgi:hypothetical protein
MAKNVAWDIIKHYSRPIDGVVYNEAELTVKYANGSRITLYGADNPDSLRGIGLWGVVFDEYSQQPSNIFTEIISPTLVDHAGYAIWIGTPKGKNDFYRLYEKAKTDKDRVTLLMTVADTGLISDEELKIQRKNMSEDEFNQEFYCSFEAAIKGSYYGEQLIQARKDGRLRQVAYDPLLKVHTVWDLGVGQALSIGFYQRLANELRMIDYWEGTDDQGIIDGIGVLQRRPYVYGKHFAPHDIKAKEISTGQTRWEVAAKLGINFEITPKIGLDDGIEAGKRMWERLWVNEPKCSVWIDNISQYRRVWDDNRGMFKEEPYHDFSSHSADVHRYAALTEDLMTNEDEIQTARVFQNREQRRLGGNDAGI